MKRLHTSSFRRLLRNERGGLSIMAAGWIAGFTSLCGVTVDVGQVMQVKRALQTSTDSAALAAAQDINAGSGGTAVATAISYSSVAGNKNADSRYTASMVSSYPKLMCLSSTGISCTGPDNANAIVVKQQAVVKTYFALLLGVSTVTVTATSTAGARGGGDTLLDVMMILDTTQSMTSPDTSCLVANSTRITCAEAGARKMLTGLLPCMPSLASCGTATNGSVVNPLSQVGLMVFPGLTATSQAAYDVDCAGTPNPTVAKYNSTPAPVYQVVGLSSDYRISDAATTLNTASNIVKAVGGGAIGCQQGVAVVGGVGTYLADAIMAAQTALKNNGRSNATKVIVVLSDGDANTSYAPTGHTTNQCKAAITAAQAASTAGTLVFSIAYGAPTTNSCTTDTPTISGCQTMQQIASNSQLFYASTVSGSGSCTSTSNNLSDLVSIFDNIQTSISNLAGASPRLLLDSTT